MGQGYGKIGTRRRSGGAWQWMLIGFFPGILCGGAIIFGVAIAGFLEGFGSGPTPTAQMVTSVVNIVEVVTATSDPAQPTVTPFIITATPDANAPVVTNPTAVVDNTDTILPTTDTGGVLLAPSATSPGGEVTSFNNVTPQVSDTGAQPTQDAAAQGVTGGSGGVDALDTSLTIVPATIPAADVSAAPAIPDILAGEVSTLVTIPGTTFRMGTDVNEILIAVDECQSRDAANCDISFGEDSTPAIEVQLDTYQMEVSEVTFGQYIAFLNYLRSEGQNHLTGCEAGLCIQTVNENSTDGVITFDGANYTVPPLLVDYPVYSVTWEGAKTYCEAIGRRLPTEAEWELAARGTEGRIYPWGNIWDNTLARTNRSEGEDVGPIAIRTLPGNVSPYGVADMAGNVAEWVNDWYSATYYQQLANQPAPVLNPPGANFTGEKVLRGGSWNTVPFFTRTVHRQSYVPRPDSNTERFPRWIGFRCAADAGTDTAAQTGTGTVRPGELGAGLSQPADAANNTAPVLDSPESETTANNG
ncbi:MAG: SUMF1/EgtB/PvdO family nonheme iron enzyme [Aggregatilineales bacterium]